MALVPTIAKVRFRPCNTPQRGIRTFKPDRLSAFSDGVIAIAIAITLLVLGLEVPSVHKVPAQQLPEYIVESVHPLLGYVGSFVLIGTYWLQHYAIFHFITLFADPLG